MKVRTVGLVLLILLVPLLAGWAVWNLLKAGDERRMRKHIEAEQRFILDAAQETCIRRDAMIEEAEKRGWEVSGPHVDTDRGGSEAAASALSVMVKPGYFVGKNPGKIYEFDQNQCLIRPQRRTD